MRFLLRDDMKTYTLDKFDSKSGIIHLKNTTKTTTKENIKEFLYVAEDELEIKNLILNTEQIVEVEDFIEDMQEVTEKTTKPKKKNK